jgi:hypothetical protein
MGTALAQYFGLLTMADFAQEITMIGLGCLLAGTVVGFTIGRGIVGRKFLIISQQLFYLEKHIMTTIDEFIAAQTTYNTSVTSALDGISGDITNLNDQIAALIAAQGGLTPEQQVALDALALSGEALAQKAAALDALTPPAVPAP